MVLAKLRVDDLFEYDIHRTIEEVIKVDQTDEAIVAREIREYVVTEKIQEAFTDLLERYLETPQKPHEGIGIWISGFFGSGKSSFAKILGYILENRTLLGDRAVDLFLDRLPGAGSDRLRVVLHEIIRRIPTQAIIFDVATDRMAKSGSERITTLMYRALLRNLGYSQDFNFAELEINLEAEGKLAEFEALYEQLYGRPWRQGRELIVLAINQASRVLHEMDPVTYPSADSWAKSIQKIDIDTDPNRFADRVLELMKRRGEGRAVIFVIDEVGQYVARSTDKMLDLQGVVQALGVKGRGKVWVAVTSQERLDEIVSSLDQTRIELARLQDRFPLRVDLVAADIAEVTSRRVLAKRAAARDELERLFETFKGQLATFTRLDGSARYPGLTAEGFVRFYPFLPYQIDLIVDIISGLRLQAGGSTHTGGSSRTIIKLAQQAIISDRVGLGSQEVGALVTLDMVYDLIEQFVHPDRRADIDRILRDFPPEQYPLVGKVAKAICLLEFVRNVKRSPETLAAVLHPHIHSPSLLPEVQAALDLLKNNQWIEEAEGGWRLLTPEGKKWAKERQNLPEPREGECIRYQKVLLAELFKDVRGYRHRGHRTFRPSIRFAGEVMGNAGDVDVELLLVDEERFETARKEALERSRESQTVFWVAAIGSALYKELDQYHRSFRMIETYKRSARDRGVREQLEMEERRLAGHASNVKNLLSRALMDGDTYFRGVRRDARSMAEDLSDVLQQLFAHVVPALYPKFDLAAVMVEDADIFKVIEGKNLGTLSEVCHVGPNRLGLVVKEGGQYKPNADADIAAEIFQYIDRQHRMGEKVTGKQLVDHFRGFGYGWDPEPVRLATAILLRAGKLELTAAGQRIQSHTDPGAREVFTTLPGFRAASFAPKSGGITWEQQVMAGTRLESIYGKEAPLDDPGAIAQALKEVRDQESAVVHDVQKKLYQAGLRGADRLDLYLKTLNAIANQSTDDLIKAFLDSADDLAEWHQFTHRLKAELGTSTIETVREARQALRTAWSALEQRAEGEPLREAAQRLRDNLESERWFESLPTIRTDRSLLVKAYVDLYRRVYDRRREVYLAAIETVKGHARWTELSEVQQRDVLLTLNQRAGVERTFDEKTPPTDPTILEMEAHIEAVDQAVAQAIYEIEQLTQPKARIERVKVSQFVSGAIEDEETLEEALGRLRDYCAKLLQQDVKVILE